MLPIPAQPKHLLTTEEAASVIAEYQQSDWHSALKCIIDQSNVSPQRALKALSTLVNLDRQTKTDIRYDTRWNQLLHERQTPLRHSFFVMAVVIGVTIAGGMLLAPDHLYRWLIPGLATLLIMRWAWLTHRGQTHARVVIGGILLVVLSGLVAAALMDEHSTQVPAAALPLILWCLISLGGGLAFSVWGAVAPMGADRPEQVRSARIGWRVGLINLAATVLISALVLYFIGLAGGDAGDESFNALFRFMIFMIVYAAFSAYLLAPMSRHSLSAALALALPVAIGLMKWATGPAGEAFAYLLLLCAIQVATVGLTALGLLVLAVINHRKAGQEGQLTAAAIAAGVAAMGWAILRFIVEHGVATAAFERGLAIWLWIAIPAMVTATSATVSAYRRTH